VFPPFTEPHTYPSVCVIFSERTEYEPEPSPTYGAPPAYNSYSHYFRRKRSPFFPLRNKFRFPSFGKTRLQQTPQQVSIFTNPFRPKRFFYSRIMGKKLSIS
jgi:hypothetical protein